MEEDDQEIDHVAGSSEGVICYQTLIFPTNEPESTNAENDIEITIGEYIINVSRHNGPSQNRTGILVLEKLLILIDHLRKIGSLLSNRQRMCSERLAHGRRSDIVTRLTASHLTVQLVSDDAYDI